MVFQESLTGASTKEDDCGIVVQFIQADIEIVNHLPHDGQDQVSLEPIEQSVEPTSNTIAVEEIEFFRTQVREIERVTSSLLRHAIDRLARDENLAARHHEAAEGRHLGPRIVSQQAVTRTLGRLHPPENRIDDRQRSHITRRAGCHSYVGALFVVS